MALWYNVQGTCEVPDATNVLLDVLVDDVAGLLVQTSPLVGLGGLVT